MSNLRSNEDLEEAILGACIMDPASVYKISDRLKPQHFYLDKHRYIYSAILNLVKRNAKIDLLTVVTELKANKTIDEVGGAYGVSTITNRMAGGENVEAHSLIVIQSYISRKLWELTQRYSNLSLDHGSDPLQLQEDLIKEVAGLTDGLEEKSTQILSEFTMQAIVECEDAMNKRSPNIPVKNSALQAVTGGWKKQQLIIVAARPGMGKTVFGLECALYPASLNIPVAFFSQEMSGCEIGGRVLSTISGVNAMKINSNSVERHELDAMKKELSGISKYPLYIDEQAGLTITRLRNKAIKLKREKGIELLVVDYLQLCEGETNGKENREQEISKISRGLKRLAKELDIPVIALSQLNRQNEARTDKKPLLSDLRDSGAIEQDADKVIMLHRPEYYGFNTYEQNGETISADGLLVMIIAKNRGGILGEVKARWIGSNVTITDY